MEPTPIGPIDAIDLVDADLPTLVRADPSRLAAVAAALDPERAGEPFDADLEYIEAELVWVQARAHAIERHDAWNQAQTGIQKRGWHRHNEDDDAIAEAYHGWRTFERAVRDWIDARLAVHRTSARPPLGLDRLCTRHGLDALERSALLLGAAMCFRGGVAEAVEALGDQRQLTLTTVALFQALALGERMQLRRVFGPAGRLRRDDLMRVGGYRDVVEPDEMLEADLAILSGAFGELIGDAAALDDLSEFSRLETPLGGFDRVVLPAATLAHITDTVDRLGSARRWLAEWGLNDVVTYGRGTLMLFHGPPGTGKTLTAHAVADRLGRKVFNVDIPAFVERTEAGRFLPALFREARVRDAVLFFDECEALFAARESGNLLMTVLLTELERFEGVAILATNLPERLDAALLRRILVRVAFPEPDRTHRERLWRVHLPAAVPLAPDVDLARLALAHPLSGGLIKNAVLAAVYHAVSDAPEQPVVHPHHLELAARRQLGGNPGASGLARSVPSVTLADVVVDAPLAAELALLVHAVRHRHELHASWGIGGAGESGRGVIARFAGPPGTGKTLAAEALAGELHRPLMRIGAASVLSKWVGETESRLRALFAEARSERAVILIDEADSLLADRGGAQARHEVSATNTLLVELERHDGLAILTTNRDAALDPALRRRVAFSLAFERPGLASRRRIWRLMLPERAPRAPDVDLDALAELPLSGAEIRSAVRRAAQVAHADGRAIAHADLAGAAAVFGPAREAVVGFGR